MTDAARQNADEWAGLYTLLAECFKHPDEQFVADVKQGALEGELREHVDALGLEDVDVVPPVIDEDSLNEEYLSMFEAMQTPFAVPAESPYKEWYGDRDGGLLGGPAATEMERRYDALGVEPPNEYPEDHVALLLEYASILLEAGEREEYETFLAEHFDWIPAFRRAAEQASADSAFYRWAAGALDDVVRAARTVHDVEEPADETVAEMVGRIGSE
jgi:TorA maturation chaperone TorD